jgi:homoserine dehydrogenase
LPLPTQYGEVSGELEVKDINDVETEYYLRFTVADRPGVLSRISGILGAADISISSVIQKGRQKGGEVPLVMMTHKAREKDVQQSLREITRFDFVRGDTMLIRVETDGIG